MRLRSVRMKDGGAKVRVLHTPMPNVCGDVAENYRGKMISAAKFMGDQNGNGSELDGYIVMGLFSDGTSSMGYRFPERIPRALVPAYVGEILRRDVITEREAEQVFDKKFEWVE